ncbi:hypothetical protein [Staphylococcus haemolyticus]|uniref:hypothetical protein n=1 Tax=Staphylococcus haemolyticus TaxID=1283 RepID=UPI0034DD7151
MSISKEKELDVAYKELFNYSLEELKEKYKSIIDNAKDDPKQLAIINSTLVFSEKFETPMFRHVERKEITKMIKAYVKEDKSLTSIEADSYHVNRMETFNFYSKNIGKVFLVMDKRATDWIIRQQKITNDINDAIIKILESEYNPNIDDWYIIQAELHNAGIRYKESELDLITLKAINELLPMFEMELFIKQYKQNIKRIMKLWNANHKIYKDKTSENIGEFLISGLDISEKLYTKNYDLINSEEKFFESISSYSGTFLDDEITTPNVFVEGAAYE